MTVLTFDSTRLELNLLLNANKGHVEIKSSSRPKMSTDMTMRGCNMAAKEVNVELTRKLKVHPNLEVLECSRTLSNPFGRNCVS